MLATSALDWFSSLNDSTVRLGLVVGAGALVAIIVAIATAWAVIRKSEHRTRLTAMMLERGLKPEEIERILVSGFGDAEKASERLLDANTPDPEVKVVTHLSNCSYDGDDIQKILVAARAAGGIDQGAIDMIKVMANNWTDAEEIAKVLLNRRPAMAGDRRADGRGAGYAAPTI